MTTDVRVRKFEQPTVEVRAERVEAITSILRLHSTRQLVDPDKCQCGATVIKQSLHAHAVEQALIGLPLVPVLTLPPDAELLDQALSALDPDVPDDPESQDHRAHVLAWKADVTRVHETVYQPLIAALATEVSTAALAWETLAGLYSDAAAEHNQERYALALEREAMRVERDKAQAKARLLGKANGRASSTIHQQRAELAYQRDLRFEADNKRGLAVADLVATRQQVERQSATIRALINKVRELDATFDDTTLDGLVAAAGEGR